ncbi:hypothetical protein ACXJJ3_32640 [Kribbella sp. WER1]
MSRRLYRIEHHATKSGPYNAGLYYKHADLAAALDKTQWSESHPNPFDDGIRGFRRGIHRCAFASLDKLRAWFDAESLRLLEKYGFDLKIIYVNEADVIEGGHQVIYDPEGVTRVWRRTRPTAALISGGIS